jgi:short-subunit dehydrogenase
MKVSLVTGASGGIGESFARKLGARGDNVLLVARSEDKLAELCSEIGRAHSVNAQYIAMDLSAVGSMQKLENETSERGLEVNLLVNNAGIGLAGDFLESELAQIDRMIDLNIRVLTDLCYLFIARMRRAGGGAIINVASTAAFQSVPYMGAYAATKAYVLSLSEALWEENRRHRIKVMALCPGVTDTNFFAAAEMKRPPMRVMQSPDEVVDVGLKALRQGRSHVISGWTNYLMTEAERIVPRTVVTRIAGKAMRSQFGNEKG